MAFINASWKMTTFAAACVLSFLTCFGDIASSEQPAINPRRSARGSAIQDIKPAISSDQRHDIVQTIGGNTGLQFDQWAQMRVAGDGFIDALSNLKPNYGSFFLAMKKTIEFNASLGGLLNAFESYNDRAILSNQILPEKFSRSYGSVASAFTFSAGLSTTFSKALSFQNSPNDIFGHGFLEDGSVAGILMGHDRQFNGALFNEYNKRVQVKNVSSSAEISSSTDLMKNMEKIRNFKRQNRGNMDYHHFNSDHMSNFNVDRLRETMCKPGDKEEISLELEKDFHVDVDVVKSIKFYSLKLGDSLRQEKSRASVLSSGLRVDAMIRTCSGFSVEKLFDTQSAAKFNIDMSLMKSIDVSGGTYLKLLERIDTGHVINPLRTNDLEVISGSRMLFSSDLSTKLDVDTFKSLVESSDDFAFRLDSLTEVDMFNRFNLLETVNSGRILYDELASIDAWFTANGHVNFAVLDLQHSVGAVVHGAIQLQKLLSVTHKFPGNVRSMGSSFGVFGSVFGSVSTFSQVGSLSQFNLFDLSSSTGLLTDFRIADTFTWGDMQSRLSAKGKMDTLLSSSGLSNGGIIATGSGLSAGLEGASAVVSSGIREGAGLSHVDGIIGDGIAGTSVVDTLDSVLRVGDDGLIGRGDTSTSSNPSADSGSSSIVKKSLRLAAANNVIGGNIGSASNIVGEMDIGGLSDIDVTNLGLLGKRRGMSSISSGGLAAGIKGKTGGLIQSDGNSILGSDLSLNKLSIA